MKTTPTHNTMKKQQIEPQRFEFLLLINNNIICQRFFDIKGYNEAARESYEIKLMMDGLAGINIDNSGLGAMGLIPRFLQSKSLEYLWGYYNPHKPQKEEDILVKNINEKEDNFQFEVRVDGETIASSTFSGSQFPPKVRYSVNIKELIPEIISDIRYYLGKKDGHTKQYGAIKLNRHNKFETQK